MPAFLKGRDGFICYAITSFADHTTILNGNAVRDVLPRHYGHFQQAIA